MPRDYRQQSGSTDTQDRTPRVWRGVCSKCRGLSVLKSTGRCDCGGTLARGYEYRECPA